MRLAAISHLASSEAPTGAEKSLAQLATALVERGHETSVVVPGTWCLTPVARQRDVAVVEIANRACWLAQWGRQPAWKQLVRYLRWRAPDPGFRRLMIWLDRFWPDAVLVNCLPQLRGAAAARALGLPVVWHIREILPPGRRRRWFARRLGRDATRIVAVSHAVASWLFDEGLGDRVEVVHNGCAAPTRATAETAVLRADAGLPEAGLLAGFFAQIVDHKGVFDLVEAGVRAMEHAPSLGLVFAGDGPALGELRDTIRSSPYPDRIHVVPPRPEIWQLLAAVDLVVAPSRWPDPLPRTVMESMAAGRPVIAYRTGGIPEMVADGETGLLVEPGDVEGLSAALVRLAGDAGLRATMAESAQRRAHRDFSLRAHVDAMEMVLSGVVADAGKKRDGGGRR